MFEKFLTTPECMKVLSWLLNHPDGEYSAAIVGVECDITDTTLFMAVLTVLEGGEFVKFRDLSNDDEELIMYLNKESSSTQLLLHLKDEFNDLAFRADQVSPSLAYLNSSEIKSTMDNQIFTELEKVEIINMCKNYQDLDENNDFEKSIKDICIELDKNNELENFIKQLQDNIK